MVIDIKTGKVTNGVKTNSLQAWLLASRPKTLSGAAVPVMIGSAIAWREIIYGGSLASIAGTEQFWIKIAADILCFLFAFVMQIDANFINDYYDCRTGIDNEERLGPLRACQQGWITMSAMRWGIAITTILACFIGLPLLYINWQLIFVGILCVVFCFLYTTCLAGKGLGDILVVLFFGIVPVCGTAYVVTQQLPWLEGFACGLVVDTLLIVNNYRDINNDRHSGKKTLVVLIGKKYTEYLYLALPTIALVIMLMLYGWSEANMILTFAVYFLYIQTWNQMKTIGQGRALNKVLGKTARNIFVYGILISLLIITV